MKPIKSDLFHAIFFTVISIVIPPLFIVNLVLLLVQVIPRAIKNKKEQKEMKKFEKQSYASDIKPISIAPDEKFRVNGILEIIKEFLSQPSLENLCNTITDFQLSMADDTLTRIDVYNFTDFLIDLYKLVPEIMVDDITECIDIIQKCKLSC